MINVDGRNLSVIEEDNLNARVSSMPNYAPLDVINFRQYHLQPSCTLVISGTRYARKGDHDYSRCILSIEAEQLRGRIMKLTSGNGGYAVSCGIWTECISHPGQCLRSFDHAIIVSNVGGDELREAIYAEFGTCCCNVKG